MYLDFLIRALHQDCIVPLHCVCVSPYMKASCNKCSSDKVLACLLNLLLLAQVSIPITILYVGDNIATSVANYLAEEKMAICHFMRNPVCLLWSKALIALLKVSAMLHLSHRYKNTLLWSLTRTSFLSLNLIVSHLLVIFNKPKEHVLNFRFRFTSSLMLEVNWKFWKCR